MGALGLNTYASFLLSPTDLRDVSTTHCRAPLPACRAGPRMPRPVLTLQVQAGEDISEAAEREVRTL